MTTPARDESLHNETYLPPEDTAEIIDFLGVWQDRGRQATDLRPRLTGPDGHSGCRSAPRRAAGSVPPQGRRPTRR
jgi:hypothetical protein